MYNIDFVCTYNTDQIFLGEEDTFTEDEKDFIRDAVYRQELLNILGLEEYGETEMNGAINELYEKIKGHTELMECALKLAGRFMSTDKEFGLMILFAYDYMYLSHVCISELLKTGTISDASMRQLRAVIF